MRKSKTMEAALRHGYRSGLEKDCSSYLRKKKVKFEYELHKIAWVDNNDRTYTPDFVLENGIIVETKGRFVTSDRQKHKKIKKQYGDRYDIRFLFSNPNAKLSKVSSTTYAKWCTINGFLWAKGPEVPQEWLDEPNKESGF